MLNFKFYGIAVAMLLVSLMFSTAAPVQAGSLVVDGPGFKVEKKQGWFGHNTSSYQDAMGNKVEKRTGLFGRTTNTTRILGNQAVVKSGNNVSVTDANGNPLVTSRRTWFHGKETRVDGNTILHSVKDLFNP